VSAGRGQHGEEPRRNDRKIGDERNIGDGRKIGNDGNGRRARPQRRTHHG
jgi:hypothetical protein